jgi:hypothetical protein
MVTGTLVLVIIKQLAVVNENAVEKLPESH